MRCGGRTLTGRSLFFRGIPVRRTSLRDHGLLPSVTRPAQSRRGSGRFGLDYG